MADEGTTATKRRRGKTAGQAAESKKTPAASKPAASKKNGMTSKEAIRAVLAKSSEPMKALEIAEQAIPLTSLKGATPGATIAAVLYVEAKKDNGIVVQVEKGTFKLREESPAPASDSEPEG